MPLNYKLKNYCERETTDYLISIICCEYWNKMSMFGFEMWSEIERCCLKWENWIEHKM